MTCFRYMLAFGSNLGQRHRNCALGLRQLVDAGIGVVAQSQDLITEPLPSTEHRTDDHLPFVNRLVDCSTTWDPRRLYQRIEHIENALGHDRVRQWAPRHLDIDILLWATDDHAAFDLCRPLKASPPSDGLTIPHQGTFVRPFIRSLAENMGLNWSRLELCHAGL